MPPGQCPDTRAQQPGDVVFHPIARTFLPAPGTDLNALYPVRIRGPPEEKTMTTSGLNEHRKCAAADKQLIIQRFDAHIAQLNYKYDMEKRALDALQYENDKLKHEIEKLKEKIPVGNVVLAHQYLGDVD